MVQFAKLFKCAAWNETDGTADATYYRKLAVFCDGTDGTWKAENNTGKADLTEAMIAESNKITEQPCGATCDPIILDAYQDQWWADLICQNPMEDKTLREPNSCVLLCDNHLKMTIDCEYDAEGEKEWRNADGEVLTGQDIKC